MATPAGLTRFSRVITTKRNGVCHFCAVTTVAGVDHAAVNASGAWIAVCRPCASSLASQAAGVVKSIETLAAGHTLDESALTMPVEANLIATLQGTASEAMAYDVIITLLVARTKVAAMVTPAPVEPAVIPALRTMAADATASPRNRDFAQSLVQQYDRKGSLSEKQIAAAERMCGRTTTPATTAAPNGLYLHDTGRIYKLYTTQNDRQGCKVLVVEANHGTFEYVKGGTRMVAQAVADGFARLLTQDEASAFGRQYGFCVNCARLLNDDRSVAVGYGETCASNMRWFYPTTAQASAMLARPVNVPTLDIPIPADLDESLHAEWIKRDLDAQARAARQQNDPIYRMFRSQTD